MFFPSSSTTALMTRKLTMQLKEKRLKVSDYNSVLIIKNVVYSHQGEKSGPGDSCVHAYDAVI